MSTENAVELGQAIYSKKVLSVYDLWVLGISNSFIWKCPTKTLRQEFKLHATRNHLDVGVGTGYYLDKCLSSENRRVALLDLNQNSLDSAAARVSRFQPEKYHANVLEQLNLECEAFDSISINFLFHCMPGSLEEKSVLFENLMPYLNNDGVLFGSTILSEGATRSFAAKKLMSIYHKKGIFGNQNDSLSDLERGLNRYFKHVNIKTIGCVAVFSAKGKK